MDNYKKEKSSKVLYVVTIFFIIYNLQGVLYQSGAFVSQVSLFSCLLLGVFYWVKSFKYIKNDLIGVFISIFIIINFFSFIFYTGNNTHIAFNHIKGVLTCILPFFIGYNLTIEGKVNDRIFMYIYIISLLVTILGFYRFQELIYLQNDSENVVNNIAYSFVRLIPLLFFLRGNIFIKILFLSITAFYIILGAKRGAVLTGCVGIFIYILFLLKQARNNKKLYNYLFTSLFIIFLVYQIILMVMSNDFLLDRFESGNLSGRDIIYRMIIDKWLYSNNIIELLFGFGFIASVDITGGKLAHNDWLELLSNCGLLGCILYFCILFSLACRFFKLPKIDYVKYSYASIILMWVMTTFFSTWYNSLNNFMLMLLLGYFVAIPKLQSHVRKI